MRHIPSAPPVQEPESAAHLQRFIPLDSLQFQNHFVINSPNGQPLTNLWDVACDGAASIDGLPPVVREVVVLTTAPDGVPVPRVLPVDAPGPNSLRRTGGATALTSTSGPMALSQSSSRLSLVIPASPRTSNGQLAMQDGVAVSDWGETPTGMQSVRSYGNLSCRRSDNGMLSSSRTPGPSFTAQLQGPLSPFTTAPSSPGAAGSVQSARAVPPQPGHSSHQTSSYSVLPVLGDGAGAGSPSGRARPVGVRHGSDSRSRSVEVHMSQSGLPQLRMADGGEGGAGSTGALPSPATGSVRGSVWEQQDQDLGPGQQADDGEEGDSDAGADAGMGKPEAVR